MNTNCNTRALDTFEKSSEQAKLIQASVDTVNYAIEEIEASCSNAERDQYIKYMNKKEDFMAGVISAVNALSNTSYTVLYNSSTKRMELKVQL